MATLVTSRQRRAVLAVAAAILAAAIVVTVLLSGSTAVHAVTDDAYATSTATVVRRDLSAQTSVGGTLAFTGSDVVFVPSGTPASVAVSERRAVAAASEAVRADRAALSRAQQIDAAQDAEQALAAQQTVTADEGHLAAARRRLAVEHRRRCPRDLSQNGGQAAGTGSSCAAESQAVARAQIATAEALDVQKVERLNAGAGSRSARRALTADEERLSAARSSLGAGQARATNPNSTFTSLPGPGRVIRRGQSVYALDAEPVPLIYGKVTLYRDLDLGTSDGPDVLELERNLVALGFQHSPASDHFSSLTRLALASWERSLGLPATGALALGEAVVEPGPIRVTRVMAKPGSQTSAGEIVLEATSTRVGLTVRVGASGQTKIGPGDHVLVTLPDEATVHGIVTATRSLAGGAKIAVTVGLSKSRQTHGLDGAPVILHIISATASHVLVVPIDGLLALASGGYAVEEVTSDGSHHLLAVHTGLFDDADGLVQVNGAGLAPGQKIVVPSS